MFQAFQAVVRGFQCFVGHHHHVDTLFQLNFRNFSTFFVQQERRHIDRHLAKYRSCAVFQGLFLDDAQNLQRAGLGIADMTGTAAAWARNRRAFRQRRFQTLTAHFHQAKFADGAKLHAGAVLAQRVAQAVFNIAAVAAFVHVNKVDHDQATQVAQTHLAGHFVSGFQVGAGGGFFNVAATNGTGRVHVDRYQGFGVVNHNRAARRQLHGAGVGRLDLVLNLEAAKQRRVVAVAFDAGSVLGHDMCHELLGLLVHVVGVDQNVADVGVEIIANGTNHQARFLVNQESTLAALGCAVDGGPEFEQVVQVPLQLGRIAANAGGAGNDAHAVGVFQLV